MSRRPRPPEISPCRARSRCVFSHMLRGRGQASFPAEKPSRRAGCDVAAVSKPIRGSGPHTARSGQRAGYLLRLDSRDLCARLHAIVWRSGDQPPLAVCAGLSETPSTNRWPELSGGRCSVVEKGHALTNEIRAVVQKCS